MAMNKAERQAHEKAIGDLAAAKALSWPSYAYPERMTPTEDSWAAPMVGWWLNLYSARVGQGCFSRGAHSTGSTTKTNTQGTGGPWFASEREALMALRIAKTEEFARRLAVIDKAIEGAS